MKKKEIKSITVSYGDYSQKYDVDQTISGLPGQTTIRITRIEFDQFDTGNYDRMTYNIYAEKLPGSEEEEEFLYKKIDGLPVELTYKIPQ